jgi:hypothetical protein
MDGNIPGLIGPCLLVECAKGMANLMGNNANKVAARGGNGNSLEIVLFPGQFPFPLLE